MFAKVSSLGLFGLNAFPVDVEINLSKGLPRFEIVGLADAAVQESRERIKSALYTCGIMFPTSNCIVNLAPADRRKNGSMLASAMGVRIFLCRADVRRNVSGL